MRAVVQRVRQAAVFTGSKKTAGIQHGLVIFLGVARGDSEKDGDFMAEKIFNLRIFDDKDGKLNLSGKDVGANFLIVSQFTVYGDCRKGRRPSYAEAALPEEARLLYEYFIAKLSEFGNMVAAGQFQEHMLISMENDGPVTIIVNSP